MKQGVEKCAAGDGGSDWLSVWGDTPSALEGSGADKLNLMWSTKPEMLLPMCDADAGRAYADLCFALAKWRSVSVVQRDRIIGEMGRGAGEVSLLL